jgi:hypothetical protein
VQAVAVVLLAVAEAAAVEGQQLLLLEMQTEVLAQVTQDQAVVVHQTMQLLQHGAAVQVDQV